MNFPGNPAKDFILNESFQQWVLDTTGDSRSFWTIWLNEQPEMSVTIGEAKYLLELINQKFEEDRVKDSKDVWKRIFDSIQQYEIDIDKEQKNYYAVKSKK